jgi:hypothetical protein
MPKNTKREDVMRWFRGALTFGIGLWLIAGCGNSSGEDELVLSLEGFTGEGIEQADGVSGATANVDVCQGLCTQGTTGDIMVEDFTETLVNAVFVNRGKVDIRLESYTVEVMNSGLPKIQRSISANIPGGRCTNNPEERCANDFECTLPGLCRRQQTAVPLLLYDLEFKKLAIDGQCFIDVNTGDINPGASVIPRNYEVVITFSARDQVQERRMISAGYSSTFSDFDNCEN